MKTSLTSGRLFLVLVCSALPYLVNAQLHQPHLQVPFVRTAPLVDGKPDDLIWKKSTELSEFVNWSLDSYVKDEVTVLLCYDDRNLYIAFRNADPSAGDLNRSNDPKGPRDTFLWGRNHVQVRIRKDDISLQLIADPKGTQTDWKNGDINWNGDWLYSASINQTDWTAEFAIPLAELGLKNPVANESLTMSVSRSFPRGESAKWHGVCNLSPQINVVSQFGKWAPWIYIKYL